MPDERLSAEDLANYEAQLASITYATSGQPTAEQEQYAREQHGRCIVNGELARRVAAEVRAAWGEMDRLRSELADAHEQIADLSKTLHERGEQAEQQLVTSRAYWEQRLHSCQRSWAEMKAERDQARHMEQHWRVEWQTADEKWKELQREVDSLRQQLTAAEKEWHRQGYEDAMQDAAGTYRRLAEMEARVAHLEERDRQTKAALLDALAQDPADDGTDSDTGEADSLTYMVMELDERLDDLRRERDDAEKARQQAEAEAHGALDLAEGKEGRDA